MVGREGMAGREEREGGPEFMVVRTSFLHKYSRRRDACITIKESQAGRLHYNNREKRNAFQSMPR